MHLTKENGSFVKCPLIKESPVSIECKVREIKEMGSHDMFIADILSIDADEEYIDEKGAFDITKCDLIAYANGKYFVLESKLENLGILFKKRKVILKVINLCKRYNKVIYEKNIKSMRNIKI